MYDIQQMLAMLYNEPEEEEKDNRVSPPCYGCKHMCASPITCVHPNSIAIRWDPIRNYCYRLPSIELCKKEKRACQFYEPDKERGAEYEAMLRKSKAFARKKKVEEIDNTLNKIDDPDVGIEEFIQELEELAERLDKEERDSSGEKED